LSHPHAPRPLHSFPTRRSSDLQIFNYNVAGAGLVSLLDHRLNVISLADVAYHGDHIVRIIFLEPGNDDGGIETSGVREYNFFRRSEEHTSELQSLAYLVCRLLL